MYDLSTTEVGLRIILCIIFREMIISGQQVGAKYILVNYVTVSVETSLIAVPIVLTR